MSTPAWRIIAFRTFANRQTVKINNIATKNNGRWLQIGSSVAECIPALRRRLPDSNTTTGRSLVVILPSPAPHRYSPGRRPGQLWHITNHCLIRMHTRTAPPRSPRAAMRKASHIDEVIKHASTVEIGRSSAIWAVSDTGFRSAISYLLTMASSRCRCAERTTMRAVPARAPPL